MTATKYISKTLLAGVLALVAQGTSAQEKAGWELGLGVGYTNYYGDLSPYQINGIKNLYRIADFNKNYQDRPSFSLMLQKKITPTLGFMLQANYLQFSMSDRYQKKSGELDLTAKNFARSLNFRNDMKDIGLAFTFTTNNGRALPKNAFFYPSFFLGAGVSQFTVKGDLYDANNARYDYTRPGLINDGTFETNLRDLHTEQEERYDNVLPYVDLGLAFNFRLSEGVALAVQSDIKYSASDYLDDVSKLYRTTYANPAEAYAAKPGYNVVDPVTRVRGDNNSMSDFYFNNRLVLRIGLGSRKKEETFTAPVIYTLAAPYRLRKQTVDSARIKQVADSIQKGRADSAFRARIDSVKILQDSILSQNQRMQASDSAVRVQLSDINSELRELRSAVQPQTPDSRRQRIQQQSDSLQAAKKKITDQKRVSEEDRLRLRIYDFQLDSLTRESQKLTTDSSTRPSARTGSAVMAEPQRIARDPEVEAYAKELEELKKDKRYRNDESFRRNVDSLEYRFQRYTPAPARKAAVAPEEQRRMDSLQARINYLESQTQRRDNDSRPRPTSTDSSVAETKAREVETDTVVSSRIKPVPAERDTVQVKKKWYQRLFSTGKEKRDTIFRVDTGERPDTSTRKKNFFQRLFSTGKENQDTVVTVETRERPDTAAQKKNFFQRLFSTGKRDRDTVVTVETRERPDTTTRKKKWYQRLFSTGSNKTTEQTSGYRESEEPREDVTASARRQGRDTTVIVDRNRRANSVAATRPSGRDRTVVRDTFAQPAQQDRVVVRETVSQPAQRDRSAARDTLRQSAASQRRNQRQTVVAPLTVTRVEPSAAKDTAELNRLIRETEQARIRNEESVASLKAQLKRSSDSAAFYRNALVQSARVEPEPETTRRRGVFNNRRKEEEEARQRDLEQQAVRDRYLEQQRYQADQVAQLQQRINDLQANNSTYTRYQDDYSNELRRRSLTDGLSTTALVLDNANRNNSGASSELMSMREELNRLKAQVSEQDVRLRLADTLAKRDSVNTTAVTVAPMVTTPSADTSAMVEMRSELTTLREELNRLKSNPAPTAAEPAIDLKSFPVISIYFANGSTAVAPDQTAKLLPFVQAALKSKNASILLRGFADATGNAAINRQVVQKRLNAVRNLLVSKYNLSLYRISSDEPRISTERGKPNPLDRRVDLSFQ